MGLGWHQEEFSVDLALLIIFLSKKGYRVRGGEWHRTKEQQLIHYRAGRSRLKTTSQHMKKLAVDLFLFIEGMQWNDAETYREAAEYWESISPYNVAGYYWKNSIGKRWDPFHFERRQKPRTKRVKA